MLAKKINRRDFILKVSQYLLAVSVIGRGLERGLVSAEEVLSSNAINGTAFTNDEFKIIKSITSIIIPTDENPGANETGIGEYLVQVFQQQGPEAVEGVKTALATINNQAQQLFSTGYNNLSQQQQEQLVGIIATTPDYAPFWQRFRTLTVLRFYSLPEAYQPAGLPGPNVDRGGFPLLGC